MTHTPALLTTSRDNPHLGPRYRLLGLVGSGGMAEVLLAKNVGAGGFERLVVVKRLLPHLRRKPDFVAMFLDEARTVARIRHANVVHIHELIATQEEYLLVMEYLEGETCSAIRRAARVDSSLVAFIGAETAAGLHAAHSVCDVYGNRLGLIHRDVTPQNVFVSYDGNVKLLDFGVARVSNQEVQTETGAIKGKISYLAPEQLARQPIDHRTDLFTLGIVLWELMTGERLFRRTSEAETILAIVQDTIPRPSDFVEGVDSQLEAVIMRLLSRDPDGRYEDASQAEQALRSVVQYDKRDPQRELAALVQDRFSTRRAQKAALQNLEPNDQHPLELDDAIEELHKTPASGESSWSLDIRELLRELERNTDNVLVEVGRQEPSVAELESGMVDVVQEVVSKDVVSPTNVVFEALSSDIQVDTVVTGTPSGSPLENEAASGRARLLEQAPRSPRRTNTGLQPISLCREVTKLSRPPTLKFEQLGKHETAIVRTIASSETEEAKTQAAGGLFMLPEEPTPRPPPIWRWVAIPLVLMGLGVLHFSYGRGTRDTTLVSVAASAADEARTSAGQTEAPEQARWSTPLAATPQPVSREDSTMAEASANVPVPTTEHSTSRALALRAPEGSRRTNHNRAGIRHHAPSATMRRARRSTMHSMPSPEAAANVVTAEANGTAEPETSYFAFQK